MHQQLFSGKTSFHSGKGKDSNSTRMLKPNGKTGITVKSHDFLLPILGNKYYWTGMNDRGEEPKNKARSLLKLVNFK